MIHGPALHAESDHIFIMNKVLNAENFFSLFQYPLTNQEVEFFSGASVEAGEYHDKQKQRSKRDEKYIQSIRKMRIAKRGIRILAHVPFVRAVFICNIFPMSLKESSDMDVFIVVRKERIWVARILCTFALSVFGLRRKHGAHQDHVCLSFYVTDNHLNLQDIAIQEDIYLAYWVKTLLPVFDPENLLNIIQEENNFLSDLVSLDRGIDLSQRQRVHVTVPLVKIVCENIMGEMFEMYAKKFQKKKMKYNVASKQSSHTSDVIISDTMLKFHEHDRREQYKQQWLSL